MSADRSRTGGGVAVTDGGEEAPTDAESPSEAPLSDLAERVAERRERGSRDDASELFAQGPFEAVESEDLWGDSTASEFGAVGDVVEEGEETYLVDKGNFCERCRYFSDPPEVRCTHPGTTIHEFVDKEHVRVSSCPVVEERGVGDDGPVG